jgi:hypothetical protein
MPLGVQKKWPYSLFPVRWRQVRVFELIVFYRFEAMKNTSQFIEMSIARWVGHCFV